MRPPPTPRNGPADDTREHAAVLAYDGCEPSPARVRTRHRDARSRGTRAARTWAACWALAVVAVFLPVLHFVLAPLLILAGPALAWQHLHEAATLVSAEGSCPACGEAQRFTPHERWRERTVLRCEACGRRLELVLRPSPGTPRDRAEFPDGT